MADHLLANKPNRPSRRWLTSGSALIEFAMYVWIAVPLLLALTSVGIRLGRGIQATQVTRDAGHMYALGADFTLAGTQAIAAKLATNFDLSSTGNAVLIFSRLTMPSQTDCTAAGLSNCPNLNQNVFTQRVSMGNTSLRASDYGTPPSQYIGAQGVIASSDYCKQSSLISSNFGNVLTLSEDQVVWLVEGYYSMPDLNPLGGNQGVYIRLVF